MTHRDINIKMAQMMKDQSGTEDAGEKTKGGDKEDVGRATSDMVKKLERRKRMLEERLEELDDRIRWRNFIARSSEVSGSKASVGEESELEALEAAFAEFTAFRYGTAYSEAFSEAPDLSLTKHVRLLSSKRVWCVLAILRLHALAPHVHAEAQQHQRDDYNARDLCAADARGPQGLLDVAPQSR